MEIWNFVIWVGKNVVQVILSPLFLMIIATVIFIFYIFKGGTNFLNIRKIFKDYGEIFQEAKVHMFIFWGLPVIYAIALAQIVQLSASLSENLLVFLSILASALFAMLSILISKQSGQHTNLHKQVIKETASAALLEIILCIFALIIAISDIFLNGVASKSIIALASFLEYYLVFAILFNMLIIVKRLKALIDNPQ